MVDLSASDCLEQSITNNGVSLTNVVMECSIINEYLVMVDSDECSRIAEILQYISPRMATYLGVKFKFTLVYGYISLFKKALMLVTLQ